MILEFDQIGRQPNPTYEAKMNGQMILRGCGHTRKEDAFLEYEDRRIVVTSELRKETINGKKVTQLAEVLEGGRRIGYIYPDLVEKKKILFFSVGYSYFEFNFNGMSFQTYEIGLGAEQHYFCVHHNGQTVAIIHKNDRKVHYQDRYVIYALSDDMLLPMSVLLLYLDCTLYPDAGETMGGQYMNEEYISTDADLNAKFDPGFIPRVKALRGITE